MNLKRSAIGAAFLALGTGVAWAQTTTTQPSEAQPTAPPAAASTPGKSSTDSFEQFAPRQMPGQWLATEYMGMNVYGPNNERVGDVNNILIDENGKVVAILVGLGGFLGIGEKTVALPYGAVKASGPGNPVIIDKTKAELDSAPSFVTGRTSTSSSSSGATSDTGSRAGESTGSGPVK